MRLSVCITLNDREVPVLDTVFESMRDQAHDEFIIVLDRTPEPLAEYVRNYWRGDARTRFVEVAGPPGWRSPVKAWNRGYEAVTGDALYCFSSETVQAAGNVAKAKALLAEYPACYFGKCECSCGPNGREVDWGGTAPGSLLCDAYHPRPLGFIWWAPMGNVRGAGGWDEAFDAGYWYDESDWFLRLWRTGLDFVFDDSVSGTHLHHERPVLDTPEGQAGIQSNAAYMVRKWGHLNPLHNTLRRIERRPGRTEWRHV